MAWQDKFKQWFQFGELDATLKQELTEIEHDEKAKEDRFYKELEFGTGGMRGEIGAGTNRMNIYTVRKASQGLANFINEAGTEAAARGVVIAYDSRHYSPEFAMEAAKTLASSGVKAYVFNELRPTPELSFAVRYLQAYAGIVVTASHNPPEYNGYKVYGEDGAQLPPKEADEVIEYVNAIADELTIVVEEEAVLKEKGLIEMIGAAVDEAYLEQLKTIRIHPELAQQVDVKVVFTPLHGTALKPVTEGLKAFGYEHVTVVQEQAEPNGDFPTVSYPNPEEHEAFTLAIRDGEEVGADLLIATDPDADRLGIAVKDETGQYVVLTGNQTGALLLDYILAERQQLGTLPTNGVMLKTVVTSELGRVVADAFNIKTVDTLTGFKFIGEKIEQYTQSGEHEFLFGYEESYGYLIKPFARDKDAVQAALLAVEMCAFYKKKGLSLYEALIALYNKYGYFREGLQSLTLKGKEGAERINALLQSFRHEPLAEVAGKRVQMVEDFKTQQRYIENRIETIDLPSSNVIKYTLVDNSWVCLRPSGTEPKVKFYFGTQASSLQGSIHQLLAVQDSFMKAIHERLHALQR